MISFITGSGTLLGNTVAKYLLKKNYKVICGYRKTFPLNLKKKKNAKLYNFDLTKKFNLKKNIDFFIHCAGAIPSDNFSQEKYMKINFLGFKKILKSLPYSNCKKIILISSTSVYGKVEKKYLTEKNVIAKKISHYAKSKLMMEKLLIDYCKKNEVNFLILRLPAIVGKNSKNNFISNLLKTIYEGKDVIISNPNLKFNNFVHVNDVAKIIENYLKLKNKNFVFNLSTTYPIKLINICKIIIKKFKNKNKIIFIKKKTKGFRIQLNKYLLREFDIMTTKKTLELMCREALPKRYK